MLRVYEQNSKVDKLNKFTGLLAVLLERKMMLEDNEDKLESTSEPNIYAKNSLADKQGEDRGCRQLKTSTTCLLHSTGVRNTEDCPLFLRGTVKDRSAIVREKNAYFNCPMTGHTARNCRNKAACPRKDCGKNHQKLLHDEFWEKRQGEIVSQLLLCRQSISFNDSTFLQKFCFHVREQNSSLLNVNSVGHGSHFFSRFEFCSLDALLALLRGDENFRWFSKIQTKLYQVTCQGQMW